jgi:hypothetical protein
MADTQSMGYRLLAICYSLKALESRAGVDFPSLAIWMPRTEPIAVAICKAPVLVVVRKHLCRPPPELIGQRDVKLKVQAETFASARVCLPLGVLEPFARANKVLRLRLHPTA